MELEEFISKTLTSIAKGVKTANKDNGLNFVIEPTGRKEKSDGNIKFDIAVTVTKKKGRKGEIGIGILSIGLTGSKKSDVSDETVSRIKFSVATENLIL